MKLAYCIAVLLAVCFLVSAEEAAAPPSDVVVLTQSDFSSKIASGSWLVEFYAPWCGHCKHLAPIYEKVATELKGKINVAKVDCTANQEVCTNYDIQGYPTIKFIQQSKIYTYNGERTVEEFVKFTTGGYEKSTPEDLPKTEPVAAEGSDVVVVTEANLETLLAAKGHSLYLDFYAPWCGHCKKLAPTYEKVATELKGKVVVGKVDCTVETGLSKRFGIKGYPTIKFLNAGNTYEYKGDRTLEDMVAFAETGFTKAESTATPEKPTPLEKVLDQVMDAVKSVERAIKDKVWIVLAGVLVFGIIVGKVLFSKTIVKELKRD